MHVLLHSVPQPCTGHHQPTSPLETPGHSQVSLGQSLVGSLFLSPGSWCTRLSLCPPRVYFPIMCKCWQLHGGVNGDLLQEGFCHTQVCCTQSPCCCGSPLLTIPPQKTFKHSSVSVSVGSLGPGAHKICLSPLSVSGRYGVSYHLAGARPLFLDVGYLLTVTQGLHSRHSSAHQFARASLPLDVGYLLTVAPVQRNHCSRTGR